MERGPYIVGMDIGGTNIRIGAVDRSGAVRCFEKVRRAAVLDGTAPVERLTRFITGFLERYGIAGEVRAVSIGFPATLDRACTTVLQAPNICWASSWTGLPWPSARRSISWIRMWFCWGAGCLP